MASSDMHDFLNMPWTIEQQLNAYANDPRHTERHKILQIAWEQNKRLLAQIQEYILASFPTYSMHNELHCQAVLHNIECLLGEDEIRRLSPTDCFAILMTAYLHDIGMVITDQERRDIVASEGFQQMLEQLSHSGDPALQQAARVVLKEAFESKKGDIPGLFSEKLDIYNALVLLICEYQRSRHADMSFRWMEKWTNESDRMYTALFISGIPHRILLQIAECARMHQGESDVAVLCNMICKNLLYSDNGFAEDQYHPRFICVLLLLGDLLDIDNNRFHFFAKDYCGSLMSETSEAHYRKHRSVRALKITPKRIEIRADCQQVEELRILWSEISWLQEFVKECGYYWAEIAPENYKGFMPLVEFPTVKMQGRQLSSDLVTAKFQITQNKAFDLLQGASIYEERYVFLRELVQNAIDATKFQYWQEYEPVMRRQRLDSNLVNANKALPLEKFPICVDLAIKKRKRRGERKTESIVAEDLKLPLHKLREDYDFGVEVSVQDYGIGINEQDIKQIANVGTSYQNRRSLIRRMPPWLKPTGHFGVGLQSLFLMDDTFTGLTRTRRDECYRIVFHSGVNHNGYINISPVDYQEDPQNIVPYGTKFTIFVGEDKLLEYQLNVADSTGIDPFGPDFDLSRFIRTAHAMVLQMRDFLRETIGESIFPIDIREHPLDPSITSTEWGKLLVGLSKSYHAETAWKQVEDPKDHYTKEEKTCWAIEKQPRFLNNMGSKPIEGTLTDGSIYRFDLEKCKIFMWSEPANCFFCYGTKRMAREFYSDAQSRSKDAEKSNGIQLYIKGIWVQTVIFPFNDLIEYIDVKDDSLQPYLRMNRNALSEDGIRILTESIIPMLQRTFEQTLLALSERTSNIRERNRERIEAELIDEYDAILSERQDSGEESDNTKVRIRKSSKVKVKEQAEKTQEEQEREKKKQEEKAQDKDRSIFAFKNRFAELPDDKFYCCSINCKTRPNVGENAATDQITCEECVAQSCAMSVRTDGKSATPSCIAFELMQTENVFYLLRIRSRLRRVAHSLELDMLTEILYNIDDSLKHLAEVANNSERHNDFKLKTTAVDMQSKLIFYGMCLYYANQADPHLSRSWERLDPAICWQYLNKQICQRLGNPSEWHKLQPYLFIPVNGDEQKLLPFAELMMNENHFAVFSSRDDQKAPWKHRLVKLQMISKELQFSKVDGKKFSIWREGEQTIVELLQGNLRTDAEKKERWELFNRWGEYMVKRSSGNLGDRRGDTGDGGSGNPNEYFATAEIVQSGLLRWMVRNLPTIAIAAHPTGNQRLNVLYRQVEKHVFFDARVMRLTLDQMTRNYEEKGIQRFRTCAWDGLEDLILTKRVDCTIQCVTRGALSRSNRRQQMLLAIRSELHPSRKGFLEDCRTSYDLLNKLGQAFDNPDKYADFKKIAVIRNYWRHIVEFLPWGLGLEADREEDWEALRSIYEKCRNQIGPASLLSGYKTKLELDVLLHSLDPVMAPDNKIDIKNRILELLKPSIAGYWADAMITGPRKNCRHWHKLEFPLDRRKFINTAIVRALGVADGPLPDIPMDTPEEHLKNIARIWSALGYLKHYAANEYREEFISIAYDYWMSNVWQNDPGRSRLLDITVDSTACKTREAATVLYQAQIKRILEAVIFDRPVNEPQIQ